MSPIRPREPGAPAAGAPFPRAEEQQDREATTEEDAGIPQTENEVAGGDHSRPEQGRDHCVGHEPREGKHAERLTAPALRYVHGCEAQERRGHANEPQTMEEPDADKRARGDRRAVEQQGEHNHEDTGAHPSSPVPAIQKGLSTGWRKRLATESAPIISPNQPGAIWSRTGSRGAGKNAAVVTEAKKRSR